MEMYQTKNIHYKTIFKQDGQSETVEYKAQGLLYTGDENHLEFDTDQGTIHMRYSDKGIVLSHGDSILNFDYEKDIENLYQLPYGSVQLKTRLKSFEANQERIKMVYELHDQQGLLLTAYMMIRLLTTCEDSYENI